MNAETFPEGFTVKYEVYFGGRKGVEEWCFLFFLTIFSVI